jgi:hypothetical protein
MNNPLPESPEVDCYWVLPGRFLAGEYPGSKYFEEETRRRLSGMLTLGIDTWIDLTYPGELPEYEPILLEQAGWLDKPALHQRFAVPDFDVPSQAQMEEILAFIQQRLEEGHALYVHCYAGLGRTGTVVGCFLARQNNSGGEAALKQLAELRRDCAKSFYTSPQSELQWELVKNWK